MVESVQNHPDHERCEERGQSTKFRSASDMNAHQWAQHPWKCHDDERNDASENLSFCDTEFLLEMVVDPVPEKDQNSDQEETENNIHKFNLRCFRFLKNIHLF